MSVAIKHIDCLPTFVHTLILERSHVVATDITCILKHVVEYLRETCSLFAMMHKF